jgi:D-alanyl-D-alanine carboxypeptidase/D-alanyl-D-alanine-endopeptidase (penicillin-binding protein 4)
MLIQDEHGTVYSMNEGKKFIPASLTKILTAGASLEKMGPAYQFKTQLMTDGKWTGTRLRGSLYLKCEGDPSFNSEKLRDLTTQFVTLGVREIEGNIIVDDSRFYDYESKNWATAKALIDRWANPASALFVNIDPPSDSYPLSPVWQRMDRSIRAVIESPEKDLVVYRNMIEPNLWTGYKILQNFKQSGINVRGSVQRGSVPASALALAEVTSPLSKVVTEMIKSSDNYYAEMITKNLAAGAGDEPLTLQAGLNAIRSFMDHVGISRLDYHLSSGAGFSQRNLISPLALCKVLDYLRGSLTANTIFLSSLPVAGIDGTLKNHMRKSAAQGRILAKTGYLKGTKELKGVVGLAGYVFRPTGQTLTFAFIYNGPERPWTVKRAFDDICIELAK